MASAVVLVELHIQMFLLPTISHCAGASTLPLRMHLVPFIQTHHATKERAVVIHRCVPALSQMIANCLGLSTSKTVYTSGAPCQLHEAAKDALRRFVDFCLRKILDHLRWSPFFETVDCNHQFCSGELWDVPVFLHRLQRNRQHSQKCVPVLLRCPACLFVHRSYLSKEIFVEYHEYVGDAFPRCFDVSRSVSHKRDENFLSSCLNACDLMTLNSSRTSSISHVFWIFCCP